MAVKLERSTYPAGTTPSDFKCYGPPATKDTEFAGTKLADMGCFAQEEVDSNKYYHCCITSCKGKWYVYVEYGRQGASKPQFQFTECSSEAEAQSVYEKQCAEKNTKRGQWETIGGLKVYRPLVKKGKAEDLYVIRDLASRSVGLPDAKTICSPNHAAAPTVKAQSSGKKAYRCDPVSTKLMRDLVGGAVTYTRTNIVGGTIPTQSALDQGRAILQSALARVVKVGDDVDDQVNDKELKSLTSVLYGTIPKVKPLNAPPQDWILSKSTVSMWEQDIDAFETALKSGGAAVVDDTGDDPFHNFPATLELIDPKTDIGEWLYKWWPSATRNVHGGVGSMKLKHLWKVSRPEDESNFRKHLTTINKNMGSWNEERPLFQDKKRPDLSAEDRKLFWETNVGLLFHGTRTVNVPGILRENFRLPKQLVGVVITGAMFGPGTYYADDWKKSNGYTSNPNSYWSSGSGGVQGRQAFMFACDVVLGKPFVAPGPSGYTKPPGDTHCVFGKAGKSSVANNEWIVYEKRNTLRYLAEYAA